MRQEISARAHPVHLRRRAAMAVALGSLMLLGGGTARTQDPPAGRLLESLEVRLVNVEVQVTDGDGTPIRDLAKGDFTLRVDGKKTAITHFARVDRARPEGSDLDPVAPGEPGHLMVFFDGLTLEPGNRRRVAEELAGWARAGLPEGYRYALVRFDGLLETVVPFTADGEALAAAVERLGEPNPRAVAIRAEREGVLREGLRQLQATLDAARLGVLGTDSADSARQAAQAVASLSREVRGWADSVRAQNALTWSALAQTVSALAAVPGPKALVFVSEGLELQPGAEIFQVLAQVDIQVSPQARSTFEGRQADIDNRSAALDALSSSSPGRSPGAGQKIQADEGLAGVLALANAGRVAFYPWKALADFGGMPADLAGQAAALYTPELRSVRENNLTDSLRVMAEETGGRVAIGRTLTELLDDAHRDLGSYYSLGFLPRHRGDGRFHTLEVGVRRRGARVRHSSGYLDKPPEGVLADRTSAALLLAREDNPLGVELAAGRGRPAGGKERWTVPVTVSVPLASLALSSAGGVRAGDLRLYVASRDEQGRMAPVQGYDLRIEIPESQWEAVRDRPYAFDLPLTLREGRQRLAIGLFDPGSGVASFVGGEIDVGAGG